MSARFLGKFRQYKVYDKKISPTMSLPTNKETLIIIDPKGK